MYFNAETQARILRHFHFALSDAGVLMLGKSEMMISHRDLFAADDLKQRIFVKQPRPTRPRARARSPPTTASGRPATTTARAATRRSSSARTPT